MYQKQLTISSWIEIEDLVFDSSSAFYSEDRDYEVNIAILFSTASDRQYTRSTTI